ncbi:MAG TPA: bifunctional glycosyltransferase/class I SAM-dependent methyltransferase [Myxococcaceae bacterium]|nr:bifunctional glycosyltransferase/class I SAM-dependent methyltransferase [Myxococcaceae bacterium]
MNALSVVIPFDAGSAEAAALFARELSDRGAQVLLAGEGRLGGELPGVQVLRVAGRGAAIQQALARADRPLTILQDPDQAYPTAAYPRLLAPIEEDSADAVFGSRVDPGRPLAALPERALGHFTHFVTDVALSDPLTGLKAFRTEALKSLKLTSTDEEIDAEIVVKLAAQLFRLTEVRLELSSLPRRSLAALWGRARTLWRYAAVQNDADNAHEGYNTLLRMEGAPNYNAWIGRRLREHLGRRVLEVGAGIGTITRQIESGRELLVALEVDPFYVERLKNLFRGKPHVRPYLSDVALADWESLRAERIDSIVLSNVLEHIPDDVGAVRRFGQVLQPGGKLVVLVPALPQLYGAIDQAVGHHRRYTPATLRRALEAGGFEVEQLSWMNLVGIPGWFLNARVFKRRAVPPLQLRLYDRLAPLLAEAESRVRMPVGMSLFAVARLGGGAGR